jgi:hypothetical protein
MLLDITSWWQALILFEKILWVIALLFSALFILQSVVSLAGAGGDDYDGGHADTGIGEDDGTGYQFFTIKNMIAFFTMFGWTGIAAYSSGLNKGITIVVALAAGAAMVFIMALLFKNVSKLKYSGTLQLKNAINKTGNVYLFIPGARKGTGKVHIQVQGALKELDAMTDDSVDIATGRLIKVIGIIDERLLLVTAQIS